MGVCDQGSDISLGDWDRPEGIRTTAEPEGRERPVELLMGNLMF